MTCMVRAYDRNFLSSLNLESMDINQEIIYKAELLGAKIVELPAHLNWIIERSMNIKFKSSMEVFRGVISNLCWVFRFYKLRIMHPDTVNKQSEFENY